MSARAVTIADAVKAKFEADTTLASWFIDADTTSRIYTFDDPLYVDEQINTYPYIIIDVLDIKGGDADNIRQEDMLRQTMPLCIFFTCRNENSRIVKREDLANGFPGLFDIHDAVIEVIRKDSSFGGIVRKAPGIAPYSCHLARAQSGVYWLGRGLIIKEVYQDISKY
jgi:hypothetical protein